MTGRELIAALVSDIQNLDNPVTAGDLDVTGVKEMVWGPDDMMVAGQGLKGQIILTTKEGS